MAALFSVDWIFPLHIFAGHLSPVFHIHTQPVYGSSKYLCPNKDSKYGPDAVVAESCAGELTCTQCMQAAFSSNEEGGVPPRSITASGMAAMRENNYYSVQANRVAKQQRRGTTPDAEWLAMGRREEGGGQRGSYGIYGVSLQSTTQVRRTTHLFTIPFFVACTARLGCHSFLQRLLERCLVLFFLSSLASAPLWTASLLSVHPCPVTKKKDEAVGDLKIVRPVGKCCIHGSK